jgi:hypothetical protein
MSSDAHASYFGQYVAPAGDQADGGNTTRESISSIPSSQTLATKATSGNENRGPEGDSGNPSTQGFPIGTAQQSGESPITRGRGDHEPTSGIRGPEREGDPFQADIVSKLDGLVQGFRQEKTSRMETIYQILCTLHDAGLEESVRRSTLEEYTLYIDIIDSKHKDAERRGLGAGAGVEQDHQEQRDGSIGRRERGTEVGAGRSCEEEAEQFLQRIRKELLHKRRRSVSSSSGSDNDSTSGKRDGESNKKKRVYQSQLPWYSAEVAAEAREVDENRKKTRETLAIFQKDYSFAEREIRRASTAPQGFPESEWKRIFKGEAINLDVIFSNLHHIAPPKENVGRIGGTEISLGKADPARKVQTSGDWTVAWHAASKAIVFAFPHRIEELREWGDYMASEFSAKQLNAHHKLIAFDKAVRAMVGGGQAILLTDREQFAYLYSAYLLPDGIQGGSTTRLAVGDRSRERTSEACRRFNTAEGCRRTANTCRYRHICHKCKQPGHGQSSCSQQN